MVWFRARSRRRVLSLCITQTPHPLEQKCRARIGLTCPVIKFRCPVRNWRGSSLGQFSHRLIASCRQFKNPASSLLFEMHCCLNSSRASCGRESERPERQFERRTSASFTSIKLKLQEQWESTTFHKTTCAILEQQKIPTKSGCMTNFRRTSKNFRLRTWLNRADSIAKRTSVL